MRVAATALPEVVLIEPVIHRDARGFTLEHYQVRRYADAGIAETFVQDNVSWSEPGVLRGLHYQQPNEQAKLVGVLAGAVWDVVVDVRPASPRFRQWTAVELRAADGRQLFVPAGFAHGFCVPGDAPALVLYKCSGYYDPSAARTIAWNDPTLAIPWPLREPILSTSDRIAPLLAEIDPTLLPRT